MHIELEGVGRVVVDVDIYEECLGRVGVKMKE